MSEAIVTAFLAAALIAYAVCGGADFGVGILEMAARPRDRLALRRAAERAIAPVWEANHVWIILALVIVFVGFPEVHVRVTTLLHVPLVLLLIGIILRGTAFTFRYYDVGDDLLATRWWSFLFRAGSFLVPFVFGHLAAAMSGGRLTLAVVDSWSAYMKPWLGLFPLAAGIFCTTLFAWVAAVFLVGEADIQSRVMAQARARIWMIVTVVAGAITTGAAVAADVAWLSRASTNPVVWVSVALASAGVLALWWLLETSYLWSTRVLAGFVVTTVLLGYWGAVYPVALEFEGHEALTWSEAAAPAATMNALAVALVVAGVLIVPGLIWLYWLFKRSEGSQTG